MKIETRHSLMQRFYPQVEEDIFGELFRALDRHITRGTTVLDAGCGHGTWVLRNHRNNIRRLVGVDTVRPEEVPRVDDFVQGYLEHLPVRDEHFDVVLCYNVIEHLERYERCFSEFWRVLKPGGALILKTPSLLAPITLASKLLPTPLHKRLKRTLLGVIEDDVFPTHYVCNTTGTIEKALTNCGFSREVLITVDETFDYFTFNRLTYALSLLYSRMLRGRLGRLVRNQIVGVFKKEPAAQEAA